ncbi:MAG: hypothetical protein PHS95_03310 [Candidatus Pacebacteria bacterium]|nr:hypothetical protein [Candidatus Paceibacterota bacterium]
MQLFTQWVDTLGAAFTEGFGLAVLSFLPKLVLAIVVVVVGWIFGSVLGDVVNKIVKSIKLDDILESAGVKGVLHKGGFTLNSGAFFGALVKWFVIIWVLLAALDIFELKTVTNILNYLVTKTIPSIIIASIVIIAGAFIADLVKKIITGTAKAAGSHSSGLVGGIAYWTIWGVAIVSALMQIDGLNQVLSTMVTGLVAMLALAGGLAFGLGGKEAASRYIEKLRGDISGHN